jgi:phosphohistidine phosphatase
VKTLLLLRHAKAAERDDFVAEHDRPLAPRGERDAARMGEHMRELGLIPDRVLCSTAARTHRTWQLLAKELGAQTPVELMRELYNAGSGGLLETIRRSGGSASTLLVVGHSPGLHALAVALSGSGEDEVLAALRAKFPTGSLAVIRVGTESWAELAPGRGVLQHFVRPKQLEE